MGILGGRSSEVWLAVAVAMDHLALSVWLWDPSFANGQTYEQTDRQTDRQVWLVSDDGLCLSLRRRTSSTRTIVDAIISAIISARDRLPAPDHLTTRLLTTSTNTRPTAACSTLGQATQAWVCWD